MTGQIPKYGKNFRLEQAKDYHATLSHCFYVLKEDSSWYIRSDKTSKHWQIFHNNEPIGNALPSLGKAMPKLIQLRARSHKSPAEQVGDWLKGASRHQLIEMVRSIDASDVTASVLIYKYVSSYPE